jgi:hypothetical protein
MSNIEDTRAAELVVIVHCQYRSDCGYGSDCSSSSSSSDSDSDNNRYTSYLVGLYAGDVGL